MLCVGFGPLGSQALSAGAGKEHNAVDEKLCAGARCDLRAIPIPLSLGLSAHAQVVQSHNPGGDICHMDFRRVNLVEPCLLFFW